MMLDFNKFEVLTFDCYGTLIDWENGILTALHPVLMAHGINLPEEKILELYAEIESQAERGKFVKYRVVLKEVVRRLGNRLGFVPMPSELGCLINSLGNWPPFPDTVQALTVLKKRFKLAVISNVDDDLFALSQGHLKVKFDYIITSEQAKSYKPSLRNFEFAMERMGLPAEKILHVAQSLYHDIVPAKTLGLSTVWVNRRKGKTGSGATPKAFGNPDLEVPDLASLAHLVESSYDLNAAI